MARRLELSGQRFGRLTVESFAGIGAGSKTLWNCVCDCGQKRVLAGAALRFGNTRSCGCLWLDVVSKVKHGHAAKGTLSPTYRTWASMVARCTIPGSEGYAKYGARGVRVCNRWRDFENFLADMGERPKDTSIDRIDGSRGYDPDNCRWANIRTQTENRSSTRWVRLGAERVTIPELAELGGISYTCAYQRLQRGWSPEKVVSVAPRSVRKAA